MWKELIIDDYCVRVRAGKSALIAMPRYGKYAGYTFWHPSKLVKNEIYYKSYTILMYTDEFKFRLRKREKDIDGKWETIDEIILSADEVCDAFEEKEPIIYTPKPIEPEHATVDESLVDDE